MQRNLILFLIFIITTAPLLSVSASVQSCQHGTSQSSLSMHQEMDMSSNHDCCKDHSLSCKHGGLCDCDNGQTVNSIVSSLQNSVVVFRVLLHKSTIPDLFISLDNQSLYRPPIAYI